MMKPSDYINSVVGKPWVRASDSFDNGGVDCWGLVVDSFDKIDGIKLPTPPWRVEMDLDKSGVAAINTGCYQPSNSVHGAIFAVVDRDGAMLHVGRVLNGYALHADGAVGKNGEIVAVELSVLKRRYRVCGFDMRYYQYIGAAR